jgi:hypothetical protein
MWTAGGSLRISGWSGDPAGLPLQALLNGLPGPPGPGKWNFAQRITQILKIFTQKYSITLRISMVRRVICYENNNICDIK